MKFLVLPDYSNETTEQHFPVLLLIYIALSRTTASLRASSPFGGVARGHARAGRKSIYGGSARNIINPNQLTVQHFSANGIPLRLGQAEMKIYKRSLQALLSSAPHGFATRSRVLSRVASLAIHEEHATTSCKST